jgi:hypothetical protein
MASGHSAIVTDLLPTTKSRTVLLSTQRRLVTFGHSVIVTDDALSLPIPSATPCPFIASTPLRPLSSNWISSFECATTADWVAITASTRVLNQPPEPLDCPLTYAVMPSAFGSPPHHPQHSFSRLCRWLRLPSEFGSLPHYPHAAFGPPPQSQPPLSPSRLLAPTRSQWSHYATSRTCN